MTIIDLWFRVIYARRILKTWFVASVIWMYFLTGQFQATTFSAKNLLEGYHLCVIRRVVMRTALVDCTQLWFLEVRASQNKDPTAAR